MDIHPRLRELLKKRGIYREEEISEFLSNKPKSTYDPFLLRDMEEGVDLILSAIDEGRKICIYGDYDVDGVTATVIMYEVLRRLDADVMYYIPSRFDEGYGLNKEAIDNIKDAGAGMIVTVDCGSVSVEEVDHAISLGMDVLVTDHHRVTDKKAGCPVINPNQPGCDYPCKYLAGCGVAFKLAQALVEVTGLPKSVLTGELDMVALGTVADIVPLLDENRTLVKFGLRAINTGERVNLRELARAIGLKDGEVSSERISFGIAPHLNAAGRMEHASIAADIFLSEDHEKVISDIDRVIACNGERRRAQNRIYEDCVYEIEQERKDDLFLILCPPKANEGIIGIVAGKIKEKYNRPTLVFSEGEDGMMKGSGRSIDGIDLYDILKDNDDLFERFGGHKAACGLTIAKEHIETLRDRLGLRMQEMLKEDPELLDVRVRSDMDLSPEDVSLDLVDSMSLLEPCGAGNERPVASITGRAMHMSRMGSEGQYLRARILIGEGRELPAVAFRNADEIEKMIRERQGTEMTFYGTLTDNVWKERRNLRFTIEHVR